jgi:hypothetical protein
MSASAPAEVVIEFRSVSYRLDQQHPLLQG